jgi:hypothetical protein
MLVVEHQFSRAPNSMTCSISHALVEKHHLSDLDHGSERSFNKPYMRVLVRNPDARECLIDSSIQVA